MRYLENITPEQVDAVKRLKTICNNINELKEPNFSFIKAEVKNAIKIVQDTPPRRNEFLDSSHVLARKAMKLDALISDLNFIDTEEKIVNAGYYSFERIKLGYTISIIQAILLYSKGVDEITEILKLNNN